MAALRATGLLLILASGIGFLTVADDFRHVGELAAVGSLGTLGVVLTIAAHVYQRKRE